MRHSVLDVLLVALRLGLTSFGGPVAHLGYFRAEYVERRRWLDEEQYGALVGLCQFLPGPASSELGIAIGITRAGLPGGVAAWLGFTLPSALALTVFALLVRRGGVLGAGPLHGLQVVAVAVVALLLAAFYHPVWTSAITGPADAALGLAAFGLLVVWRLPPWLVVLLSALGGAIIPAL